MPDNYDFQSRYEDLSYNHTNSGILYAMNEDKLYSTQPVFDAYVAPSVHDRTVYYEPDGMENGPVAETWTVAQQEKLRADAIAKSGPKLAFINDKSQEEPPEGALPCIMGRDSPGGSVTSLDSLDEVPQVAGSGKEKESRASTRTGIMAKGGKETKSAGRRKVTFSDSIEFDDGVTGQLVTEEKQSTKVYTMLYARNANNYYNVPSSNSSLTAVHSGTSYRGNKSAGITSVSEKRTEQNPTSSASSVIKTFGKDFSVATVTHCDHPRAKPVPLDSPLAKPEKIHVQVSSSKEQNRFKESGEPKHADADVVSDMELNDSLEVVTDSLEDEDGGCVENVHGLKVQEDKTHQENSTGNWTSSLSSSVVKDSLERYVQSTAEIPAEEYSETFPSNEDGMEEEMPIYSEPLYVTESPVVTSGYQHHHPFYTTAVSAVATSPYYHHLSTQVSSGLHRPSQGTFHPNFPYPFYTSAGSTLMGVGGVVTEQHGTENSPVPPTSHVTTTNYRLDVQEAAYPSDPQRSSAPEAVASSSSTGTHAVNTGHALSSQTTGNTEKRTSTQWVVNNNETNKKASSSRQKLTSSPSSTASTSSSSSRSTRSLIPRPPSTKKSGRGRFHPGGLHRKQISARPRKAIHNHSVVSDRSQPVKNSKTSINNRNSPTERAAERQNLETKRTESRNGKEMAHSKQTNNGRKQVTSDHDGIMEGIKRNMEMMNIRTRTTAAQEQHQRILSSLRLEFGDGRKAQQESVSYGAEIYEDRVNAAEHHANTQDTAIRRVHHPRVGSAGSRNGGRPPAGINVKLDLVDDSSYQAGFDGYPSRGKALAKKTMPMQTVSIDASKVMMQKSPYEPVMNQQFVHEDRRYEYPVSTVGQPTSATMTNQEREGPSQARTSTRYERDDTDMKRSISLEKTPTDEEINHLWAHVRSYLHGGNTKSVGSDSCVNRVDVRRSRTRSSSTQQVFNPRAAPQQNSGGSQQFNGQHLGVAPQTGGSTLGGLRRYGSHEVLRRDSSSDSLSLKRSPLLQHRASRSRRPQMHAHGQNGRPPLPRPHEYNPSPSQAGPNSSVSSRGMCEYSLWTFTIHCSLSFPCSMIRGDSRMSQVLAIESYW